MQQQLNDFITHLVAKQMAHDLTCDDDTCGGEIFPALANGDFEVKELVALAACVIEMLAGHMREHHMPDPLKQMGDFVKDLKAQFAAGEQN